MQNLITSNFTHTDETNRKTMAVKNAYGLLRQVNSFVPLGNFLVNKAGLNVLN